MEWRRLLLFVVLTLVVAAPAAVWGQTLNHSLEPGSVMIFPKFLTGTVDSGDGTLLPRSAFEISVVCPPGTAIKDKFCTDPLSGAFATVYLRAKWVCPPGVTSDPKFCAEKDFTLTTTVNGTLWINPENIPGTGVAQTGPDPLVARPLCPQGFLIVWVVDNLTNLQPISFNGLFGDAVLRPSAVTHTAAYNGLTIETVSSLTTGLPVTGSTKDDLEFNGTGYREPTNALFGTVRYDDATSGIQTFIDLVVLNQDAGTNLSEDNFTHFDFYNEIEGTTSGDVDVICYKEVSLSGDLAITAQSMQGVKGSVRANNNNSSGGSAWPILGIIETQELIPTTPYLRGYAYSMYDDRSTECTGFFEENQPDPVRIKGLSALTPALPAAPTGPLPTPTLPGLPALPKL
jgi:hypothetical protein